jgi:predicted nucleic acid-binding protein
MNKDYAVVLDACVMVGAGLRDTLLRLAETPRLYVPKWSDDIIAETKRTLEAKFGKTPAQTKHLEGELKKAFPEAWVTGYKDLESGLNNDAKDRHVLAAAIRGCAQTIVTFNLKHFGSSALAPYDIEAVHPDEFLVNQFYLDDALVTLKLTEQSAAIGRTPEELLRAFHKGRSLPLFTQTIADALSIELDPPVEGSFR